jgi:hypothetical protein
MPCQQMLYHTTAIGQRLAVYRDKGSAVVLQQVVVKNV